MSGPIWGGIPLESLVFSPFYREMMSDEEIVECEEALAKWRAENQPWEPKP